MKHYGNTKVNVRSPDGNTHYFDIVAGILQGDTLVSYPFIICLDYVLLMIDLMKENGFMLKKEGCRRYATETITEGLYRSYRSETYLINWNTIFYKQQMC